MKAPVQTIRIDHARKLVDVRVAGFVTPEDAGWLSEDVRAAIRTLGDDVGKHVTLYDVTELGVAPTKTIDLVKAMFARPEVQPLWARRVAIVTGSALGRMQMQRLRDAGPEIRIFDDRGAALDWLLA